MSDRDVACLHCGMALAVASWNPGITVWVHRRTGDVYCEPTRAAPVFSDDPAWRPPLDSAPLP